MNADDVPFSVLLKQRRKHAGMSQTQLANALNAASGTWSLSRHEVGRWEQGRVRPLSWLPIIAQVLNVESASLDRAINPSAETINEMSAESVRERNQALIELDGRYGGTGLCQTAVQEFRSIKARLDEVDGTQARDLAAAVGEAAQIAAWFSFDADDKDQSRWLLHEALMMSRHAGDRSMELFELELLAMNSIILRQPGEALRICDDVMSSRRLSRRIRAMYNIRKARAYAQLNQGQRAMELLRRARSNIQDGVSSTDPPWTWWIEESELACHQGLSLTDQGDWDPAIDAFIETTRLRARRKDHRRASFSDTAYLFNALIHVGGWRDAEPIAVDLLRLATEINSGRTTNVIMRTLDHLRRTDEAAAEIGRSRPTSTLLDTADHLREVLKAAGAESKR